MSGLDPWQPTPMTETERLERWEDCAAEIRRLAPRVQPETLAMYDLPTLYGIRDGIKNRNRRDRRNPAA